MNLKTTLLIICLGVLLIAGCSDDSEDLNNAFTFENKTYKFNDASIYDEGLYDLRTDGIIEATHYRYDFILTDGKIANENDYWADSASYAMVISAYAPIINNMEVFSEGIFKYVGDQDFYTGSEELAGNHLFSISYICFDENDDGIVGYEEGARFMSDGIIRIFGDTIKYDMNFTFNFSLGKKAEGRFSGPISVFEP